MKFANPHPAQKAPSAIALHGKMKKHGSTSAKKHFPDKHILQKIFHPDYILFDWEYFSRELEFE